METALSVLVCLVFVRWSLRVLAPASDNAGSPALAGMLGLLGLCVALLRPELSLLVLMFFLSSAILFPSNRRMVGLTSMTFCGLGLLYYVARFVYFGLLLPLPFYLKQGTLGLQGLRETFYYLRHILVLVGLVTCLAAWLVRHTNRRGDPGWAFPAALTLAVTFQGGYYVTLKHIMGMGFRFFQPIHVLVIVLACIGLAVAWEWARQRGHGRAAGILAAGLVVALTWTNVSSHEAAKVIYRDRNARAEARAVVVADGMRRASQGRAMTIAMNDCGAVPFYTDFHTVDLAGLNNRAIARRPTAATALKEIVNAQSDIVILVSGANHGLSALKGFERLSSEQILGLGYEYVGSIKGNDSYFWLVFGRRTTQVDDFARALAGETLLERAPVG